MDADRQDEHTTTGPLVTVGLDGAPGSREAVLVAARSARRRGARLEAVVVVEPPVWTEGWSYAAAAAFPLAPSSEITEHMAKTARAMVDEVLGQVRREDGDSPRAEVLTLAGDPAHDLREAARGAVELVVGHRGRGGAASLLMGSVGRASVLHALCPVTVVPADGASPTGDVVVGVDGSEDSRAALEYALREAARRGVPVRAVVAHQAEAVTWPAADDVLPLAQDLARVEVERARDFVDRTTAGLRAAGEEVPEISVTGSAGSPTAVLTDAARDAALLVVGHRGRGALRSTLFGSTGLGCVVHAVGPVTVVPAAPAARPAGSVTGG